MNENTENFERLRRLLKVKRYEQPPPGYFHGFSGEVIARIKLGERGEDSAVIERLLWEAPWLQRIWAAFEAKPVLAGAFGLAMCSMLIWGGIYSENGDVQPVALIPVTESAPGSPEVANVVGATHPLLATPAVFDASSTNPVPAAFLESPLFRGAQPALRAQPAGLFVPARY